MPWYRTGTVSVTLNSNAVVGTGTAFIANSRVGDAFLGPDGGWYEVTNIASDTALSIAPPYRGGTNGAGVYALTPVQGYTKDLADQARTMIQQWGGTLAGLGPLSSVTIAPVVNGGTGANNIAQARTNLGLGTAATATLGTAEGNAMPTGAFGLGAQSAPLSSFSAKVGFTTHGTDGNQSPVGGAGGTRITQCIGGNFFNELVITASSVDAPALAYRQFSSTGGPGAWNTVYTNKNTTRAADGTLKAI